MFSASSITTETLVFVQSVKGSLELAGSRQSAVTLTPQVVIRWSLGLETAAD